VKAKSSTRRLPLREEGSLPTDRASSKGSMRGVVAGGLVTASTAWVCPPWAPTRRIRRDLSPVMAMRRWEDPFVERTTRWLPSSTWIREDDDAATFFLERNHGLQRSRPSRRDESDESPHSSSAAEDPGGTIELPLIVVDAPLLPAGTHAIHVASDPKLERLYDEIVASGARRFVVALGRQDAKHVDDDDDSLTVFDEELGKQYLFRSEEFREEPFDEEPSAVAEVGCVLYLTDVRDTDKGRVCEHAIQPVRVRLQRVVRKPDGRLSCRAAVARDDDDDARPERGGGVLPPSVSMDESFHDSSSLVGSLVGTVLQKLDAVQEAVHHRLFPERRGWFQTKKFQRQQREVEYDGAVLTQQATLTRRHFNRLPSYERQVVQELLDIAALQKLADEDVCFREEAVLALGAGPGAGVGSLWHLANHCWLSYLRTRATVTAHKIHSDLHERLLDFLDLTLDGLLETDSNLLSLPLEELPADLQRDLLRLKAKVADEIEPIVAQHQAAQVLLDADSHQERCHAFRRLLHAEKLRLQTLHDC